MCANGNSFEFNGSSAYGDGIQDPESTQRLGDRLMYGWAAGFGTPGNAL